MFNISKILNCFLANAHGFEHECVKAWLCQRRFCKWRRYSL